MLLAGEIAHSINNHWILYALWTRFLGFPPKYPWLISFTIMQMVRTLLADVTFPVPDSNNNQSSAQSAVPGERS